MLKRPLTLIKHLKVHLDNSGQGEQLLTRYRKVIAKQALEQEEAGDFNNDFPETIPINLDNDNQGCAC